MRNRPAGFPRGAELLLRKDSLRSVNPEEASASKRPVRGVSKNKEKVYCTYDFMKTLELSIMTSHHIIVYIMKYELQ